MKNNLWLKIFAVVVALFIWLQLTLMSEQQSKVNLELRLNNATPEDSLLSAANKISCQVQGRGMDIIKLHFSKAYVEMEAKDLRAGNDRNFSARNVPFNLDVNILSVDPASVALLSKSVASGPGVNDGAKGTRTDAGFPGERGTEADGESTGGATQDPVTSLVLSDIQISSIQGLNFFPSTATLKVQGKASVLASLPKGVVVTASANPDARGFYSLSAKTPDGVALLDITPRQVRAGR